MHRLKNKTTRTPHRQGFTIVELLIVIVVIGILAAITIVAFNGVQDRAKTAAAQAAASQAYKKILTYAIDNTDAYPAATGPNGTANLTSLGITPPGSTTYEYSANNSSNPKTFCLTVTNGNKSLYVSNSVMSPATGACPGHGNGGAAAITNLVPNPNSASGLGYTFSSAAGQVSTNGPQTTGGPFGGAFYRRAYTATSSALTNNDLVNIGLGSWGGQTGGGIIPVSSGDVFTLSAWVRSSKAQTVKISAQWITGVGSAGVSDGANVTLVPNTWTRLSVTNVVATSTAASVRMDIDAGTAGTTPWVNGDTLDATAFMLTTGSTLYSYSDGNTPGWVWNGTADSATSTGSPL